MNVNELIVAMLRRAIVEARDRQLELGNTSWVNGREARQHDRLYWAACNALRTT